MRIARAWLFMIGLAVVAHAEDVPQASTETAAVAESELPSAAEIDAQISEIERDVSGADEVVEFVPKKPLSADKATSLPSDI